MTRNEDRIRVTLLGTGTSTGVPVIGCACPVCTSGDPRDERTRSACVFETQGLRILIDIGPDFRRQALREGIRHIDAVLFTHHHFDHVGGIDDLRPFLFKNRRPVPCYARRNTVEVLQKMFTYIFEDGSYPGVPNLALQTVDGPFTVTGRSDSSCSVSVIPIDAYHGSLPLFGYRIGKFAYLTDTNRIPEESFDLLHGLDVLVLDALREEGHPTHFSFDEAIRAAQRIDARRTYFTHMTHSTLHADAEARLPEGIRLGYDGLVFETGV